MGLKIEDSNWRGYRGVRSGSGKEIWNLSEDTRLYMDGKAARKISK